MNRTIDEENTMSYLPRLGSANRSPAIARRALSLLAAIAMIASLPAVARSDESGSARKVDTPLQDGLKAFRGDTGEWRVVGDTAQSPHDKGKLVGTPGEGALVNGADDARGRTRHLVTRKEYGDVQVHIEFMVPQGSNSGVYFQGRYEIQILDSWDVKKPKHGDCGGIYQRWDPRRGRGKEGFEGHPPRVNAARPPGTWQSFDAIFMAPRFDAAERKVTEARFVKVVHNGVVVHEDLKLSGPTRASLHGDEKPLGPMMVQGDHGPVAIRAWEIWPLEAGNPGGVEVLKRETFDETGFVSIFDGETLEGWHVSAKTGHSRASGGKSGGRWVVEDGAITGSQDVPGNGGIILSDKKYVDFEVVVEMRNDYGPDSGLFLRSTERGQAYQYMVDYHNAGNLAGIYGEGLSGGIHRRNFSFLDDVRKIRGQSAPYALPIRPQDWPWLWRAGQWNELRARIVSNPPRITTWINGVRFMEFEDTEARHVDRGNIALQVHGGGNYTKQYVRYRGIRVKELGKKDDK